jgi:hypothetical protein
MLRRSGNLTFTAAFLTLAFATVMLAWTYAALDAAFTTPAPSCGLPASPAAHPAAARGLAFKEARP